MKWAELPVKKGVHSDSVDGLAAAVEANKEIAFPLVVKAQVQVGGRGKAGGIKMADNMDELKNVAGQILGMNIKGHIVNRLMAVEKADVASEMYLSIMLDRLTKCPLLIFSPAGGVEIEETAKTNPELIFKVPVNPLSGMTADITSDMASKARPDREDCPRSLKKYCANCTTSSASATACLPRSTRSRSIMTATSVVAGRQGLC